jgi:hypothetical protein
MSQMLASRLEKIAFYAYMHAYMHSLPAIFYIGIKLCSECRDRGLVVHSGSSKMLASQAREVSGAA